MPLRKFFAATEILVFDFELFIGVQSWCQPHFSDLRIRMVVEPVTTFSKIHCLSCLLPPANADTLLKELCKREGQEMAFILDSVVPWGRSFEEYVRMFDLTEDELGLSILSCGDGPASFNCRMYAQGRRVVSCDPIYQFSAEQL